MSLPARKTRWYLAACVCLLLLAAALRFYGLPNDDLSEDEARAAKNSWGTVSQTLHHTRYGNSSPILYPLALWAVQKVERSPASVRALPAAASVATVAVILLLLPRLGFSRRAAFLSALLLTLSVPAIEHAQDVREYSIDALWAALLTAALLGYWQSGRKIPLCAALFLAPLIQYGLTLFGAAVIAAALFTPSPIPDSGLAQPYRGGWRRLGCLASWARRRLGLLYPAASFAAGCAVSYWATYRFHRDVEGFSSAGYLSEHYYQGAYDDAAALGEFIYEKTLNFLQYHLPQADTLLPLAGAALLLWGLAAAWRRFSPKPDPEAGVNPSGGEIAGAPRRMANRTIAMLFLCCTAVAIAAAVLRIYPFGGLRHTLYLAPVVFLILGLALHRASSGLAALVRWQWAPAGALAVSAGLITYAGFADLQQRNPHRVSRDLATVSAELRQRAQFNEVALILHRHIHALDFQQGGRPDNQYYAPYHCDWLSMEGMGCIRNLLDAVHYANRIVLVHKNHQNYIKAIPQRIQDWRAGAEVQHIDLDGGLALYVITNFDRGAYRQLDSGEPAVRSVFDLYLFGNQAYYVKEPCRPADVEPPFFLHIVPDEAGDLPPLFQELGFDQRGFQWEGTEVQGRCVDAVRLPDYPIAKIRTGQYLPGQNDSWQDDLWRETIPGPGRELRLPAGELLAHGVFDLYRDGNELHYAKAPCRRADIEPMFFLHIVPADPDDLPPEGREGGFQGLDFRWNGERLGERCIATERLPDYPIARIHTGQYIPAQGESWGQGELWREEIALSAAPPP